MEQSLWKWVALFMVAAGGVMVFLRIVTNEIHQSAATLDLKKRVLERKKEREEKAKKRQKELESSLAEAAETRPAPPSVNGRSNGRSGAGLAR